MTGGTTDIMCFQCGKKVIKKVRCAYCEVDYHKSCFSRKTCCSKRQNEAIDEQEDNLTNKTLMDALKFENNLLKDLNHELKTKNALLMEKINTLEEKISQQQIKAPGENQESITEAITLIISTSLQDYFKEHKLNTNEIDVNENKEKQSMDGNESHKQMKKKEQGNTSKSEQKQTKKKGQGNTSKSEQNKQNQYQSNPDERGIATQSISKSEVQNAISSAMQHLENSGKPLESAGNQKTNITGTNSFISNIMAAEKRSWFFVGNLKKDTSEQQMESHLRNISVNVLSCKKLENKNNDYTASFKIGVEPESSNIVLDPNNWPLNVSLRPFRFSYTKNHSYNNNNTRRPNFQRPGRNTRRYY